MLISNINYKLIKVGLSYKNKIIILKIKKNNKIYHKSIDISNIINNEIINIKDFIYKKYNIFYNILNENNKLDYYITKIKEHNIIESPTIINNKNRLSQYKSNNNSKSEFLKESLIDESITANYESNKYNTQSNNKYQTSNNDKERDIVSNFSDDFENFSESNINTNNSKKEESKIGSSKINKSISDAMESINFDDSDNLSKSATIKDTKKKELTKEEQDRLKKGDLNMLTDEEIKKKKEEMDVNFNKNIISKDDPNYIYDKKVDFVAEESNDWDEED